MPTSGARRVVAALLAATTAVGVLAGCDPVAWARKSPEERAAMARTLRDAASQRTTAEARCDDDMPAITASDLVPYSRLDRAGGFTRAVASASSRIVALGAGTVAFDDFTPVVDRGQTIATTSDGGVLGPAATGLLGAGAGQTVLEVRPGTSTRASQVPTVFPQTIQLDALRVTGDFAVLKGFTIRGTEQGHLYNGLRIDRTRELRASHLAVSGIPGDDVQPPGETFAVNDYRTTGSVWSDVDIDGAGVGASGFGANGSRQITLCRVASHDNRVAMGFAFWQTNGIRLIDCRAEDNGFSGFNFERVSGSTVLVRPVATGNRYGMRIATDRVSGRYTIIDPDLTDGHWTVALPKRWYGTTNRQRQEDVTLVVDGRPRPDLLRFEVY